MGDYHGAARQGSKPRPLGQVKTESLHFQHAAVGSGTLPLSLLPVVPVVYPEYYPPSSADSLRASVRSMRELRESLRHAALLNIVAAANNGPTAQGEEEEEDKGAGVGEDEGEKGKENVQDPRPGHASGTGGGNPLSGKLVLTQRATPASLTLQVTSSRGSPFPQTTEGGGRSAGSGTYHLPSPTSGGREGAPSPSPHSLVANLLSPRVRTISIPRPGPGPPPSQSSLQGSFTHRSLSQLSHGFGKLAEAPRTREGEEGAAEVVAGDAAIPQGGVEVAGKVKGVGGRSMTQGLAVVPLRGHAVDRSPGALPSSRGTADTASASLNPPSALSRVTSSSTLTNTTSVNGGGGDVSSRSTTSGKTAEGKEERGGQHVRRHLTPGKKRELVKRLTEMAKSETAEDGEGEGEEGNGEAETPSARDLPPMIILSRRRQELTQAGDTASPLTASLTFLEEEVGASPALVHRTRSLSSLIASSTYTFPSTARGKTSTSSSSLTPAPKADAADDPGRAVTGSALDLSLGVVPERKEGEGAAPGDPFSPLFTNGIVGRTILGEGEVGKGATESRPLLPPSVDPRRRHARVCRRRSTLGLRDRGPLDPSSATPTPSLTPTATPATTTNTTTTTIQPLNASEGVGKVEVPPPTLDQPHPSPQPSLPALTITSFNRDRAGARTALSSSGGSVDHPRGTEGQMHLFQHLEDQCEKLQRQLAINFGTPRRIPPWQHMQHVQAPNAPPIKQSDISAHLQCVPLGEGRGDKDTTHPSSTSNSLHHPSHHLHRQPLHQPVPPPPRTTATTTTITSTGTGRALSDVEEQSMLGEDGGSVVSRRTLEEEKEEEETRLNGVLDKSSPTTTDKPTSLSEPTKKTAPSSSSSKAAKPQQAAADSNPHPPDPGPKCPDDPADPVLQTSKEPRYQGFSSKVPESESRSQFHYIRPGGSGSGSSEEETLDMGDAREMKYRVLKALDQDVYYDFQHRKYRSGAAAGTSATVVNGTGSGSASGIRCNNEEDRPRVLFYKVKVKGES